MFNYWPFSRQLSLITATAILVVVTSTLSSALVVYHYDQVISNVRQHDFPDLTNWSASIDELATLHTELITLVSSAREINDEQAIYLQGKTFTNHLDSFLAHIQQYADAATQQPNDLASDASTLDGIRQELLSYRASSLTAIAMLTVNPALADRYLVSSALSLNVLNHLLSRHFHHAQQLIDSQLQQHIAEIKREAWITSLSTLLLSLLIFLLIFTLGRRLRSNFAYILTTLDKLKQGRSDLTLVKTSETGEFADVVAGLEQFRLTLSERQFTQQKTQAIFDSILEGVVVIDVKGTIIRHNPVVCKMFGYSDDALLDQNVRLLMPEEHARHHDDFIARYMQTGKAKIIGQPRRLMGQRCDGSQFDIQLTISQMQVNRSVYFVGVITDISERMAYEQALRVARDEALESARLKSEFLANMSHEIRTPMNGIIGMVQALESLDLNETERQDSLRVLLNSSQILLTLINDILDLSKIEAGKIDFQQNVFSPLELMQDTVKLFTHFAEDKGLTLTTQTALSRDFHVISDPVRVRQMLSNLISNAVKFTDTGGIHVELKQLENQEDEVLLEFSVTDTGKGIPLAQQNVLFQRFSQVDGSRTRLHGGTGLGLAIVLNLAKLMGGDVGVSSTEEHGSRFWFYIRATLSHDRQQSYTRQQLNDASVTLEGHVLLVDDNAINRKVMTLALAKLGLTVDTAAGGQEAVKKVQSRVHYDVILMDLHMPEVDGFQAAQQIRCFEENHALPVCPIIAVTADVYEDSRLRCLEVGMNDFITKPVILYDLQLVLTRCLKIG